MTSWSTRLAPMKKMQVQVMRTTITFAHHELIKPLWLGQDPPPAAVTTYHIHIRLAPDRFVVSLFLDRPPRVLKVPINTPQTPVIQGTCSFI